MSEVLLHIKKSGLQTTVQDSGRTDYRHLGVAQGGALDKMAARNANTLVGNPADTPVLEVTLSGPKILFVGACTIAITGADLEAKIDGKHVPRYQTLFLDVGAKLTFGKDKNGCRAYIAVNGKWEVPNWLGSTSAAAFAPDTLTPKSIMKKGSDLRVRIPDNLPTKERKMRVPIFRNVVSVGLLPGPEYLQFEKRYLDEFIEKKHRITTECNRMGIRLSTQLMDYKFEEEMISSGVIPGTVQITHGGQPVVLLVDSQTTGGYPRVGIVKGEDMDKLAQLKPGDFINFYF